jgi:osmotically-inducible protein OsmY
MSGFGDRDFDIHREILSELDWEPGIDSTQVGVQVDRGIAILLGTVSSLRQREAAQRAARRVGSVRAVVDALDVRIAGSDGLDQAAVARVIADAVVGPGNGEDTDIEIIVDGNDVILEGYVSSVQERRRIEQVVQRLTTNQNVRNRLAVANALPDALLVQRAIRQALVEQAEIDARNVHVEVGEGIVVLHGTVRQDDARKQAAQAALMTGVAQVQNLLTLEQQLSHDEPQTSAYVSADVQ